jgi:hypothetical protein
MCYLSQSSHSVPQQNCFVGTLKVGRRTTQTGKGLVWRNGNDDLRTTEDLNGAAGLRDLQVCVSVACLKPWMAQPRVEAMIGEGAISLT